MAIAALSTAGFSRYIAASSSLSASQKAFQSLQQGLASGNLNSAKAAFTTYQRLNQTPAGASAGTATATKFSTDLTALGSAISAGSLTRSRSAFATLQADLKTSPSQAITNAQTAAAQTVQWVNDLLNLSSARRTATPVDLTTSILNSAYGQSSSTANSADPTVSLLQSAYGAGSTSNPAAATASTQNSAAGSASGARVNIYA